MLAIILSLLKRAIHNRAYAGILYTWHHVKLMGVNRSNLQAMFLPDLYFNVDIGTWI